MPHIRPYQPKDHEAMRRVCLATAEGFSQEQAEILWCMYCDYYTEQEPENALALAGDDDEAGGYLLIAASWPLYTATYREKYLPRLQKLSPEHALQQEEYLTGQTEMHREYPAHLHIDLLPPYQGQGWGPRLLDVGLEGAGRQGCPGIMLGVGDDNPGAIRFYERYGFTRLGDKPGTVLYGLKL